MTDLLNWGAPGVIIGVLAAYYAIKDKSNQKEREAAEKMHREEREKMMNTLTNLTENSNKAINSVTNAVTEISTLIKNNRK